MLEATVDEAVEFLRSFAGSKPAQRAAASLSLLQEVGLGYLQLGQPINTLSGGESQRLKLVRHLAESRTRVPPALHASTGLQPRVTRRSCVAREEAKNEDRRDACPTLFLLDEPTTGLHFDDVRVLLGVFQKLVDAGHSLVVIEHNLDVLKCADWIIDLGPDAGDDGGELVVAGTPEDVACCTESHTGRFLRDLLRIR
jgi:excinuclease ABC subunit A